MNSILNYIITLFKTYNSFGDFYIKVFGIYLSYFDFIMACIWVIILFCFFLLYFIKEYSLKVVVGWVFKRLFFAICVGFLFFYFSNATYCDTYINRGMQNTFNNFFNNKTTTYVVITIFTITGFVAVYKYVPYFYNDLKTYTNYKDFILKKRVYESQYNLYQDYLVILKNQELKLENNIYLKSIVKLYNNFMSFFGEKIVYIQSSVSFFRDNMPKDQLCKMNISLARYKNLNICQTEDLFYLIQYNGCCNNYLNIVQTYNSLLSSNKKYRVTEDFLVNLKVLILDYSLNTDDILKFYLKEMLPHYSVNPQYFVDNPEDAFIYTNETLRLVNKLDLLYKRNSDLYFQLIMKFNYLEKCSIIDVIHLDSPLDFLSPISEPKKNFIDINYPLDNLEGLKFIGINLGYVFFYPIFYCSNKILGTVNPLSYKLFNESLIFLLTLIKFY